MTARFQPLILAVALCLLSSAVAEEVDTRAAIGITSGRSVNAAVKRAEKENKQVLVLVVDASKQSQAFHIKGMMEFEETKDLVKEHFILVMTDFEDKNIRDYVKTENRERPAYVLLGKDGKVIQKGTAAVGGRVGNDLVKGWVGKK
jgi:thioredoxin-related protein